MKTATRLRKLLSAEEILVAPSAYDALSAKIVESAGFKAIGTTGYGMSASLLGKPDVGLLTMSEIVVQCKNIAAAVNVPVMADADTGYGNPINVIRTVKEFEKAGIAGIYIEDQVWPKKCGYMKGRDIVEIEEATAKIRAAVEARDDPDFLIIARTDADFISPDEVIKRGNAYADAGADLIKPQPHSKDELKLYCQQIKKPLHIGTGNLGSFSLSVKELEELGNIKIVTFPLAALLAATKAMMDLMREIKETGRIDDFADRLLTFDEFTEFIGLPEVYSLEERYKNVRYE